MTINEATSVSWHPIRELVCPDLEEPIQSGEVRKELRRTYRYARNLPGEIVARGGTYPMKCLDIGYGGIRVSAPATADIAGGDQVAVRISLGGRQFRDGFSVVDARRTPDATVLHLSL